MPASPAGTGAAGAPSADFMAVIQAAMSQAAPAKVAELRAPAGPGTPGATVAEVRTPAGLGTPGVLPASPEVPTHDAGPGTTAADQEDDDPSADAALTAVALPTFVAMTQVVVPGSAPISSTPQTAAGSATATQAKGPRQAPIEGAVAIAGTSTGSATGTAHRADAPGHAAPTPVTPQGGNDPREHGTGQSGEHAQHAQRSGHAATPAVRATPATRDGRPGPATPATPATPAVPATTAVPAHTRPAPVTDAPQVVAPVQQVGPSSAPTSVQPTTSTAAVTAPTTAPSAPVDNSQVTNQVFPEVTSLVSRGPGTHRITLTLNPEQLGEVRVVMTMRAGAVHVRLAAGHDARTSLVEGSPELARLLEHAGATEAKVVVRELPAAQSGTPAATSTPPTTESTGTPLGTGTDRSPDQHAGTRADHPAREGAEHRGGHREPVPPVVRPTQQVSDIRAAGVDLTM
ncbi:MAG: flagellar hook-length control protein FliK [Marmoricola sp.]